MRVEGDKRFVVRKSIPEKFLNRTLLLLILKTRHRKCFCKRCVPENFTNFTAKYLCWSLFLINLQTRRPEAFLKETPKFLRAPVSKYICDPLLLHLQVIHEKDTANEA